MELSRKEALEQGYEWASSENGKSMKRIKEMDVVDIILKPYIVKNSKIIEGKICGVITDELMLNFE